MKFLERVVSNLPDGCVQDVRIGIHWTAVVVETNGVLRCGIASTVTAAHAEHGKADVLQAGQLNTLSGRELAGLALPVGQHGISPVQVSIGLAAINALLPHQSGAWVDVNAEQVIARHGAGKKVALIGHFPFIPRLRSQVGELSILERRPGPGELPEEAAAEVLPQADLVAITSMTIINGSLDSLLALVSPHAKILLLGPSTPLSPLLFAHGIDLLSGSVVTDIEAVLRVLSQGGTFRQIHPAGVRLVTMARPELMAAV